MLTQSYAATGSSVFITGVAYQDRSGDGFYSIGEGRGNVTFSVAGGSDVTGAAGGYGIAISPSASVDVTISAGRTLGVVTVDASSGSVKLDLVGGKVMSSSDLDLVQGIKNAGLLGIADVDLGGNDLANKLTGNAGHNVISGHGGRDKIVGAAGNDVLDGGLGHDRLWGGDGDDILNGAEGRDVLRGNAGSDRLSGGQGRDKLFGGSEADVFVFGDGFGRDQIMDFDGVTDGDVLDLTLLSSVVDFADLMANHAKEVKAGVLISSASDTVLLKGTDLVDLQVDDFLFA